jgi:Cellulose biosynthesis protein BcsS
MSLSARSSCRNVGSPTTRWGLSAAAATLVGALCSNAAFAQNWYVAPSAVVPPTDWLVAIDVSGTATSNHTDFAYGAATFALGSTLQQSGLRLRLEGLGGTYGFEQAPSNVTTTGKQYEGGALVGYQQVWNFGSLGAYIGANVRENTVPSTDATNSSLGTRVGFKAAVDAYLLPAPATMMSVYGSYSTAYDAYYARFRAGYSFFGFGYLGPELAVLGDDYYNQTRVGAHYSAMQLGALQVGVSGGYVWQRDLKDGYYGSLELRTGF